MNNQRRKMIEEAQDILIKITDEYKRAMELIQQAGEEEREYFDNMPESLQGGEKGVTAESAADVLEEIHGNMDSFDIDEAISGLEEARQ